MPNAGTSEGDLGASRYRAVDLSELAHRPAGGRRHPATSPLIGRCPNATIGPIQSGARRLTNWLTWPPNQRGPRVTVSETSPMPPADLASDGTGIITQDVYRRFG